MGLTDNEAVFYDALAENGSAKQMLGDAQLRFLTQELVDRVKQNITVDWQVRENARAQIRVLVKPCCTSAVIRRTCRPVRVSSCSIRLRYCARTGAQMRAVDPIHNSRGIIG